MLRKKKCLEKSKIINVKSKELLKERGYESFLVRPSHNLLTKIICIHIQHMQKERVALIHLYTKETYLKAFILTRC